MLRYLAIFTAFLVMVPSFSLRADPLPASTAPATPLSFPDSSAAPSAAFPLEADPTSSPSPPVDPQHPRTFIVPTWADFLYTLQGMKALDITSSDDLVDEYAQITNCDLYLAFHNNEFKWRRAREGFVKEIREKAESYSADYSYNVILQLNKYDFTNKIFRFPPKGGIENINTFTFSNKLNNKPNNKPDQNCDNSGIIYTPSIFRAVLTTPVYVHGIPMSPEEGEYLIQTMDKMGNADRSIYVTFNLHIKYIEKLIKPFLKPGDSRPPTYTQSSPLNTNSIRLDASLVSVQFFLDREHKILLYTYTP